MHSCNSVRGKTNPCSVGKCCPALRPGSPTFPGGRPSPHQPLSAADKIRGWQSHPPVRCTAGSSHPSPDEVTRELAGAPGRRCRQAHTRCPGLLGEREDETPAWKPPRALQSSLLDSASGSCSEARVVLLEAELQRSSCEFLFPPHHGRCYSLRGREKRQRGPLLLPREGHKDWDLQHSPHRAKRQPAYMAMDIEEAAACEV